MACLARAVPGGDHDAQSERVDEAQTGEVDEDPLHATRLCEQQSLAKLLVAAHVAGARDPHDRGAVVVLYLDVERLVKQMM